MEDELESIWKEAVVAWFLMYYPRGNIYVSRCGSWSNYFFNPHYTINVTF
jgi:hypothetical protein